MFTYFEKQHLEDIFNMADGYFLDFSNKEFKAFFQETVGIDIYSSKYCVNGRSSKACRFRAFYESESKVLVVKILRELRENYSIADHRLDKIINRLNSCIDLKTDFIKGNVLDFGNISAAIESINLEVTNNSPENALDRVHTLATGVFRCLTGIEDAGIPLHGLYAKCIKILELEDSVHKILKVQISFLESLNCIRNSSSLAHPNNLFRDQDAAFYIIKEVYNLLEFLIKKNNQ